MQISSKRTFLEASRLEIIRAETTLQETHLQKVIVGCPNSRPDHQMRWSRRGKAPLATQDSLHKVCCGPISFLFLFCPFTSWTGRGLPDLDLSFLFRPFLLSGTLPNFKGIFPICPFPLSLGLLKHLRGPIPKGLATRLRAGKKQ